jgi:hypothetical protein
VLLDELSAKIGATALIEVNAASRVDPPQAAP